MRFVIRTVCAGACALSLIASAGLIATAQPASAGAPAVPLAAGVLRAPDGKVVAGAPVQLLLFPEETTSAGTLDIPILATTTSASDGSYTLSVGAAEAGALSQLKHAPDFKVIAGRQADFATTNFTRKIVASASRSSTTFTAADLDKRPVGPTALTLTSVPLNEPASGVSAASMRAVPARSCTATVIRDYGARHVVVGRMMVWKSHIRATYTYSEGASSSLGIGVSETGRFGTFKADGELSRDSAASQTFPSLTKASQRAVAFTTGFRYRLYKYTCIYSTGQTAIVHYETRSVGWAGGDYSYRVKGIKAPSTFCAAEHNGGVFTKTSTKHTRFSGGASLADKIGINLSAQTGFSSGAKQTFKFSATRRICGVRDDPPGSPGELVGA